MLLSLTPLPEPAHACIAPEPSSCTVADECELVADACVAGECCAVLGGVCSGQNPCCDGAKCGLFAGGNPAVCCRDPLEPCERNEDCCQRVCVPGPTGGQCAFF
jgi:hypothetical protein